MLTKLRTLDGFWFAQILSSSANCSMEEVAATGPGVRFFQLYVYKDRNITITLVRRAEQFGFKAIVLTVDTPRLGRREADIKNRFKLPSHLVYKNLEGLMNLEQMDKVHPNPPPEVFVFLLILIHDLIIVSPSPSPHS